MDIKKLLSEYGKIERELDEWVKNSDYSNKYVIDGKWAPDPKGCWPEWRIALALSCSQTVFSKWWESHGAKCELCSERRGKVGEGMLDPTIAIRTDARDAYVGSKLISKAYQMIEVIFDSTWPKVPVMQGSTGNTEGTAHKEMPYVEFHKLEGVAGEGIESLWLATWDNLLYLLVAGPKEALEKWDSGVFMLSRSGSNLGTFTKASKKETSLLVPCLSTSGKQVLCFRSNVRVAKLTLDRFSIPGVFSNEIKLLPSGAVKSRLQRIVIDFVSENNAPIFLSTLPQETSSRTESLTLNFYLRFLYKQGRLDAAARRKLMAYPWLADDLKLAFQSDEYEE